MPTHVFNTDLDSFSEEQIEKLGASRAAILEPAFDDYLMSDDLHETPLPPSSIQLLPASDLNVKLTRASKGDTAMEMSISKISDPDADNFMGFSAEENCIVFKGEMGLFDRFLEFAESITQDKDVTVVFKTANEIRIPRQGLEYGLSYEKFAARVEVLECAMWSRASLQKGQGEMKCMFLVGCQLCSLISEHNSKLDASSRNTGPSTPPRKLALDKNISQSTNNSDLDNTLGRSMAECKSPSSDSSLSPPPEIITTPPSFKRLRSEILGNGDLERVSDENKTRAPTRKVRIMTRGSTRGSTKR
ncbi:hypothetical protein CEP54_011262 [Fusarium duplospermum]|uniref:Uncharacterized protein n=1 Tax=Fusarium duplospermum TaxID=1325734 RepID=A0A428PFH9_9HYPO|nr:hypothetical protein CEP54_011262 [Fusarium duplospermum]